MSHEDLNERLHDYLEGVLTSEDRQEFERHLETCQLCREEIHMVRRLDEVVATLPEPELPPRFMEKLQAALDEVDANPQVSGMAAASAPTAVQGRKPAAVPRRSLPWLAVLAAAACLIVAVGLFWPRPPGPDSGGGSAAALQVWLASADGSVLLSGDPVTTTRLLAAGTVVEAPSRSVLAVGQSTEVRLDGSSSLQVGPEALQLTRGRIFVAERGERLRVETPQAVIVPAGTDYEVTVEGDRTTVRVWDGQVAVRPRQGGASQVLSAGQQVTVTGAGVSPASAGEPDDFVKWNQGLKPHGVPPAGSPLPKAPISQARPALDNLVTQSRPTLGGSGVTSRSGGATDSTGRPG